MTLTTFKTRLKGLTIVVAVIIYSSGLFLLGKSQALDNVFKYKGAVKNQELGQNQVDQPIPYTDSQAGNVIGAYVKLCANTHHGFEITYPNDWFTTYNHEREQCTFFAPYSFVVPQDPTSFAVPVKVDVINSVDWQETLKFYQNPNDFVNVVSYENLELDGREVQRVKASTTQAGTLPSGLLKISYLFFNAENSIVLTYQQQKVDEKTEPYEKTLDEMARSLKFR